MLLSLSLSYNNFSVRMTSHVVEKGKGGVGYILHLHIDRAERFINLGVEIIQRTEDIDEQ